MLRLWYEDTKIHIIGFIKLYVVFRSYCFKKYLHNYANNVNFIKTQMFNSLQKS